MRDLSVVTPMEGKGIDPGNSNKLPPQEYPQLSFTLRVLSLRSLQTSQGSYSKAYSFFYIFYSAT